jgi:putative membrane protein
VSSDDAAVGPPERLHPLFLLTGIGGSIRGLLGAYAAIIYLAAQGYLTSALIGAAGVLLFSGLMLFLHWKRFQFRVGANEIRIDSGIVSRTHRSIPFDRVQDVDISQGPVMRLLGLASVKFETGGSAAGGAEEGVLQAIALERAQELRALVRAHRSGEAAAATQPSQAEAEEKPPVYAMDVRRLLLAGLFNFSLAVFAGLIGLTQTAGDLIGFDPLNRSFWESMLSAQNPYARLLLENRAAAAVAGLLSLVLVGIATGIVRTALRDYGFRLDRTDVGLRRRRGLLTRTDVTLPARRAQAAIVATGPVRERFGWRELKLQSLARDEGGSGDHVLAPLADDCEVDRVLVELGWRPLQGQREWNPVSPFYVWSFAVFLLPLALIALAQMALVPWIGMLVLAALALLLLARRLEWRRMGYAFDGDRLLIRRGWWRRTILVLPIGRIQSLDLAQSFVARRFGTASLQFGVAGGSGFSIHSIPALPENKARALRSKLLSLLT